MSIWETSRIRPAVRFSEAKGLLPKNRAENKTHFVRRFDSLRETAENWAFALMVTGLADAEAAEAAENAPAQAAE